MIEVNFDKWRKFLESHKIYEFLKEIPTDLKNVYNKVQKDIGEHQESFSKTLNLADYDFCNMIVNVTVTFKRSNKIKYYSNVNIYDVIFEPEKTIQIPVIIEDVEIDNNKMWSLIAHELRHIYDVITINDEDEADMRDFIKSQHIEKLRENENFLNFTNLVYLSLEHELIARNTMLYEQFKFCDCSKNELYELFKKTFIYEALQNLKNFNHLNIIKNTSLQEQLKYTNSFISYIGGEPVKNSDDVKTFYLKWENFFIEKSNEYLSEAYEILDEIANKKINESFYYEKYASYNEIGFFTVKKLLKNIYEDYIKL